MVTKSYNIENATSNKLFTVSPIDTLINGKCHTIQWEHFVRESDLTAFVFELPKSFEYPKLYTITPQDTVEFKFCFVNFKKEEKWQQFSSKPNSTCQAIKDFYSFFITTRKSIVWHNFFHIFYNL